MPTFLKSTIKSLLRAGILASDERPSTANTLLANNGIEPGLENRRRLRSMLFTTKGLENYISGVILNAESVDQETDDGIPFVRSLEGVGIVPGVKVDLGTEPLPNHPGGNVTLGLDGLCNRMAVFRARGIRFVKWRSVFVVGHTSDQCIFANADGLARYAALAQQCHLVPIVEPEILRDGDHVLLDCEKETSRVLDVVFRKLKEYSVDFKHMILKVNMVTPGDQCQSSCPEEVANATIRCLHNRAIQDLAGIYFLSGGQSSDGATRNLAALNHRMTVPWKVSFSFGRAIQNPAIEAWKGSDDKLASAQRRLLEYARKNHAATARTNDSSIRSGMSL